MTASELLSGELAVDELAGRIADDDPGASSHWRHYHRDYDYAAGVFKGLTGFGNFEPRSFWRERLHRIFLRGYRRTGAAMPDFARLDGTMDVIAQRQGRAYGLDPMRQTLSHAAVLSHLTRFAGRNTDQTEPLTIAVIGDGFGVLSALILADHPRCRVVLVNLTKNLLVDVVYLRRAFPELRVALVDDADAMRQALSGEVRAIALEARRSTALRAAPLDLAYNIASMQEMDPPAIAAYFDSMRAIASDRPLFFYCCNRVEKRLPDGTVSRFEDYPWSSRDVVVFDERCPWHQTYYAFRPPFIRAYDGPMQHRLVRLAGSLEAA